ncbi:MAG: hypothetical protein AAF223_06910 [Bacteroidota bacterium]
MKAIKLSDYGSQIKLAANVSYHEGWVKSLENFEKHLQDSAFKGRRPRLSSH